MSPLLVADTFFAALDRLSNEEKLSTLSFLSDFADDPRRPGFNLKKPQGARSPSLWSARVNRDLRAILHQEADTWALLYVDHHDQAYDWATRRRAERHPATGTLQIVETVETIEEVRRFVQAPMLAAPAAPLLEAHDDAYLLSLGAPESWLPTLRKIRAEDQLLAVCEKLPPEVAERLMDLAAGELVTPPTPLAEDRPVFDNPDTRRRFYVVDDSSELRRVLEAPLERWIAFLHPSQRQIVEGEYRGPFKVAGAAGTGKTVVALHRARHLARQGCRVLLTSFVTTLCRNLERSLRLFCSEAELAAITVSTVHKQALDLVRRHDPALRAAGNQDVAELLNTFGQRYAPEVKAELVRSEWESVIELQGLRSWAEYRGARRTGRGRPLSVPERRTLWQVFSAVLENLGRRRLQTWAGMCREAERLLAQGEVTSPYDAVVVDEVQDLRPPDLRFLRQLCVAEPGRLMVVGDAGQRIFPGGFSLSSLGIDVRGRSRTLSLNYRTSEQIRRVADRLAGAEIDDMDGGRERRRTRSLFRGPEPILRGFKEAAEEHAFAVETVRGWLEEGLEAEEIAVFARTAKLIEGVAAAFAAAGIVTHRLADEGGADLPGVHLGTMHRAKGLEFKAVLAVSCSRSVLPNPRTVNGYGDPVDRREAEARERHLLYVVMTRARDALALSWVGAPSPLLADCITKEKPVVVSKNTAPVARL